MSSSYTALPLRACIAVEGQFYFYLLYWPDKTLKFPVRTLSEISGSHGEIMKMTIFWAAVMCIILMIDVSEELTIW
jgi:hypothetical protein